MGKITCSICGMSSFVKQDGVFICSTCGHKYSVDEIQKLLSSNEQSTSKDNCDDVIHDIPNNQAADFFDYQRKYRDYVQWKARKKHLFCCDDTIAGGTEAVVLKADGTVLSTILHTKMRKNDLPWQAYRKALFVGDLIKEWFNVTELLKIFPGGLLGKRSDGTLCFAGAANSQYVHGQTICANTKCVLCDFAYADEQLSVFCLNEDGAIFYVGNSTEKQAELSSWRNIVEIFPAFISFSYKKHLSEIIGIKEDGSLALTNECMNLWPDAKNWVNIKKVFCKSFHFRHNLIPILYGIKMDGSVISAVPSLCNTMEGNEKESVYRMSNVYGLRSVIDVVDFSIGNEFAFIHNGGKVTFISKDDDTQNRLNQATQHWREVIDIINGYSSPIALTSHGSVLITSESTWYDTRISVSDNFCNSNKIKYILQPRCTGCLFALMEDGSVTAEKILTDQGCNYSFDELKSWHNVVEIENFGFSVAAVQSDGIVRVLEPKSISESESIVSFSYGTVGARTTYRDYCHCSFAGERLFDKYAMTDKEQKEALEAGAERIKKEIEARRLAEENAKKEAEMRLLAEEKQKKENEIQQLTEERENISLELANLKGLFTKKRRNELESQLSAVDATISQIQKELAVLQAT